jgi:hypothetical protein
MIKERLPAMEARAYSYKELRKIIRDNAKTFERHFLAAALDCRKYQIYLLCDGDTERAFFYSETLNWTDLKIIAMPKKQK